jgi:ABC-type uncharacterized transport system involved in gliding motility auxiliary subunit
MATEMDKRKRTYASNATIYAVFTIGALVLLNLIGTRVFGRLDLTQNGIYTLSPSSKDIVKALPDPLTIKAYISSELPPELKTVSRYVRDLMDEYKSASKGKVRFEAFDPSADKKIEDEANACKVAKLQVQVMRQQKFEVSQQYLGLCLQYNGQSEAIPQVTQLEGLEYMTTSLIKRMSQKKRKVAFTTGHNEYDISSGFQFLKQILSQEYEVTNVNPSQAAIGDDVDALVVGGPKQAFDEKGLKELDAFLMKGKGAIFLVDGMAMSSPQGNMPELGGMQPKIGQPNNTGLARSSRSTGSRSGRTSSSTRSRACPGSSTTAAARWSRTRPCSSAPRRPRSRTRTSPSSRASRRSSSRSAAPSSWSARWRAASPRRRAPGSGRSPRPRQRLEAHRVLLLLARDADRGGQGKGLVRHGLRLPGPAQDGVPDGRAAPLGDVRADAAPAVPPQESKKPVRLVIVGDSDFASDEYVQAARIVPVYQNGPMMLFNSINWTIEDETLTPVRTKSVTARPLNANADDKAASRRS